MSHFFFCFPFPCVSSNEITGSERNTRRGANRGRGRGRLRSQTGGGGGGREGRSIWRNSFNLCALVALLVFREELPTIFLQVPPPPKKRKTRWQRFSLRPKRENDFSVRGGGKKLAAVGVCPVAVSQRHSPREKKDGLSGMSGGRKRDNSSARGRSRTVVGRRHSGEEEDF